MKHITKKLSAITIAILGFTALHTANAEVMGDGLLAVANDSPILKSEFNNTLAQVRQSYQAAGQTLPSESQLKKDVLDGLIIQHLQFEMLERSGYRPKPVEVNRKMLQLANAQGIQSLEDFQKKLNAENKGKYKALQSQVIEELSLQSLQQSYVSDRIKITDEEADAFLSSPQGQRALENANKEMGASLIVPEWQTRHILIRVDGSQTQEVAKQKIEEIYKQLGQGADFSTLASTYSEDPGSSKRGGDLGWVREGVMVPEFEAMMKRTPVKDYSTPFTTQYGWHILQVVDKEEKDISKQVYRSLAKDVIYQNKAPQAYDEWIKELKSNAYIQVFE